VAADPLPHAFVLTAIVIAFAVTVLMLAMAVIGHNDDTKRMPPTGEERAT
jgi:multicomponent Na+:H+ antiporter subunit C